MGLTRIRAEQISDIDYKQAVRVITLANITLSGGAPAEVDGVSLTTGDRVLVAGQSAAAQNGLYQVQTVGAGSNGTWVRTTDANEDGEIQPGMVVMVTQGTEYADTPWKLVTNGEIIIGTTELTFEENYSLAFGNIFANGTAVIANAVSAPVTFAAGDNISITGNNTTKTVTIAVTGISLNSIANGTSNVNIATANGNVTTAVAGNTILTVASTGANVAGLITATGNITGGNLTTGAQVVATGNVTGGNLTTAGRVDATGNVTGGNLTTAGTATVATLTASTLVNATATTATTSTTTGAIRTAGGVGVGGNVHVGGALVAVTKSFAVQHPSKPEMILYHGCLEGPEHAVYVRGRCRDHVIQLPDYWAALIDQDSITVHLTPMAQTTLPAIRAIYSDRIELEGSNVIDCFYLVHATRRDVPGLEIEVPGTIQDLYRDH